MAVGSLTGPNGDTGDWNTGIFSLCLNFYDACKGVVLAGYCHTRFAGCRHAGGSDASCTRSCC